VRSKTDSWSSPSAALGPRPRRTHPECSPRGRSLAALLLKPPHPSGSTRRGLRIGTRKAGQPADPGYLALAVRGHRQARTAARKPQRLLVQADRPHAPGCLCSRSRTGHDHCVSISLLMLVNRQELNPGSSEPARTGRPIRSLDHPSKSSLKMPSDESTLRMLTESAVVPVAPSTGAAL